MVGAAVTLHSALSERRLQTRSWCSVSGLSQGTQVLSHCSACVASVLMVAWWLLSGRHLARVPGKERRPDA